MTAAGRDETLSPSLAVVVPTALGAPILRPCLSSLAVQDRAHQVIVVADGAPRVREFLNAEFSDVLLVELPENRGFCAAANAGLRCARSLGADWILLLNDDTQLDEGCLAHLLARADSPEVGIVAPLLLADPERDRIESFGVEINLLGQGRDQGRGLPLAALETLETRLAAATGGALLIRRAVLEATGGLDEDYTFYFEDVDFCLAALDLGWEIAVAPEARVFHRHSATLVPDSPRKAYYLARNQVRLVLKTFPWPHVGYALPLSLGRLWLRLAGSLVRGEAAHSVAYAGALGSLLRTAPGLISRRRPMRRRTFERIKRRLWWG